MAKSETTERPLRKDVCQICIHPQADAINRRIARLIVEPITYRDMAKEFKLKQHISLFKHAKQCLKVDVSAIKADLRLKAQASARSEFESILAGAKGLWEASAKYLADPTDPFKFALNPWDFDIEVTYLDQNDRTKGENPEPKKKTALLSTLLAMFMVPPTQKFDDEEIRSKTFEKVIDMSDNSQVFNYTWDAAAKYFMRERQSMDIEAEKIKINHNDIKKFALDCLGRCESIIDKFAKIEGIYKENQPNDDMARASDTIKSLMQMEGLDMREAMEYMLHMQHEKGAVLIEPETMRALARKNGIMELTGIQ